MIGDTAVLDQFFEYSDDDIAEQMTCIDSTIFSLIRPHEFLNQVRDAFSADVYLRFGRERKCGNLGGTFIEVVVLILPNSNNHLENENSCFDNNNNNSNKTCRN